MLLNGQKSLLLIIIWVCTKILALRHLYIVFLLSVSHWIALARCIRVVLKYAGARAFVVAIKFNYVI